MRSSSPFAALAAVLAGCSAPGAGVPDTGYAVVSWGGTVPGETAAPVWSLDEGFAEVRVPLAGAGGVALDAGAAGTCVGAEAEPGPVLVRLDAGGAIDPDLAGGVPVPGLTGLAGVALRPDGGCVAAGSDARGIATAAAVLPDGSVDPAFTAAVPGDVVPLAAISAPAGGLTLLGFEHTDSHVVRLTADGAPDPAYGAGGEAGLVAVGAAGVLGGFPDGSVLAADAGVVSRLDPRGAPDTAFGGDGRLDLSLPFAALGVSRLAAAPDGEAWVLAEELGDDGMPVRTFEVRLDAGGSATLAPTAVPLRVGERVLALAPPFAVGLRTAGGCTAPAIWRLEEDGGFDPSFGDGGVLALPARSCAARATAAALDPEGRLLVAGEDDGLFVVRLAP